MKDKNTKAIAVGVGLLAIGQGAVLYNQSGQLTAINEKMEVTKTDNAKIKTDLEKFKISNDSVISINSGLTESLIIDDKKIKTLTAELNAAKLKLSNLQKAYRVLKAKSEAMAQNLKDNNSMPSNNTAIADAAKKRNEQRAKKDSIERARMEAIAARRIQDEKNRLEAIAAKKAKAEAEKQAKLEAIAAKNAETERLMAEKAAADKAKLEALAALKSQAEKNKLEAIAAKKAEADRIAAEKAAAEKNRLDAIAAKKAENNKNAAEKAAAERNRLDAIAAEKAAAERNRLDAIAAKKAENDKIAAEKAAAERNRLDAIAAEKAAADKPISKEQAEKNRIEAIIAKKKADIAKARQAISDKNNADEMAIANRAKGIENTAEKKPTPNSNTDSVERKPATVSKVIANQNPQVADKLTKIKIVGMNASTFRYIDEETKEEEETDDSSEVGFVKVSFTIPQNFVVRASDRNYYIQILDEQNNLVGDNVTETIDGEKVTYCHRTNIKYKNRTINVSENVFIKDLKEGTYTVKVLDRKDVVSQTKIVLN